jgi:hypothetical protein
VLLSRAGEEKVLFLRARGPAQEEGTVIRSIVSGEVASSAHFSRKFNELIAIYVIKCRGKLFRFTFFLRLFASRESSPSSAHIWRFQFPISGALLCLSRCDRSPKAIFFIIIAGKLLLREQ